MLMSPMRDGRTTSEDSDTQLLICELLSFANTLEATYEDWTRGKYMDPISHFRERLFKLNQILSLIS